MKAGLYELEVLVHGHSVREYPHHDKHYIEGKKDSNFTLRVHNRSSEQVLAVVSVDGLSVMDGKDASFESGGYIIHGWSHVDIPGWRLDLGNVAKFIFSGAGGSYAAQLDKPKNVGVIGCAIFREKPKPVRFSAFCAPSSCLRGGGTGDVFKGLESQSECYFHPDSYSVQCNAGSSQETTRGVVSQQLGTGFGEQSRHQVYTTSFDRQEFPDTVFELCYDSREALLQRGVDLAQKPAIVVPCPFPGNPPFCRPPAGWTGK